MLLMEASVRKYLEALGMAQGHTCMHIGSIFLCPRKQARSSRFLIFLCYHTALRTVGHRTLPSLFHHRSYKASFKHVAGFHYSQQG